MTFRSLSPPDNTVFSATTPASFTFGLTIPLTTLGKAFVNGEQIASFTAAGGITSLSDKYTLTRTGSGTAGDLWTYTVTPEFGWQASPSTVSVEGRVISTDYDQTRTLTVGGGWIGNHTETALSRMISQFHGSATLRKLVASYVDQVQELEDVAVQLLHDRTVQSSTGDRLDGLGQIVNLPRGGREDVAYRQALRAELAVLSSQGSVEELLAIAGLLSTATDGSIPDFEVMEYYPKEIALRPIDFDYNQGDLDPQVTTDMLRRAVSAATNLQFIWAQELDASVYTLSSQATVLETSTSLGLANDAQTSGGYLAQAL